MLALRDIRLELGLLSEATESDEILLRYAAQVTAMIRQRTGRGLCWVVDSITIASNVMTLRSPGHGLRVGDTVKLQGTATTPTVDGEYVVTAVPSMNTLKVAWAGGAVSGTGEQQSAATLHPLRTVDVIAQHARTLWVPQSALPYLQIDEVHDRIALTGTEWELVDPSDYRETADARDARALSIERIEDGWPLWTMFARQQYTLRKRSPIPTVRLKLFVGTDRLPYDLQMAALSLVCDMFERQGTGKDLAGFQYGGAGMQKLQGEEAKQHMLSGQRVIDNWAVKHF